MAMNPLFSRRQLLAASATTALSAVACSPVSAISSQAVKGRKIVLVLLRGAADGLSLLAPVGDPGFAGARGSLSSEDGRHKLNDMFALHPEFGTMAELAKKKQGLFFHAVGLSNPTRSHFDAQNLLETGGREPYRQNVGILNRVMPLGVQPRSALALAQTVPPALLGPQEVASFAPTAVRDVNHDLYDRIAGMYDGENPRLSGIWRGAVETRAAGVEAGRGIDSPAGRIGALAAKFLTGETSPDIVMIESTGWDTHSNQLGRLARQARNLDGTLAALHRGLGEMWADTLVIVASEFGRTVATNGNGGSDHGTGGALFALGGALTRTGVITDWPGLRSGQLFENRDLMVTTPVESVIAGLVAAHLGIDAAEAVRAIYPDLAGLKGVVLT
ncbi:DUF1501 domain-containing protein [Altererythrobacter sp. ZODW24]|uniref:DUF1501 domain-containing protein n=1 Tax=Altererythrobacter sp. ZODW24 TaxID=2185142 RepID=UPI000DF727F2|nr:DUF1501 domain-containing protein [Altererythrobacter sp. ZODW24]